MTADRLREIAELARKATPGPWKTFARGLDDTRDGVGVDGPSCAGVAEMIGHVEQNVEADARFIAAANPQTVLELVAEIERLRLVLASPSQYWPERID